ncbi:MAG: Ig-like domain-containing protein [Candidatus Moraniibacteriota bacterium]|nr:MAG: Ig-like domain-containing protein [Candidatus Moranbacteria bacterium]
MLAKFFLGVAFVLALPLTGVIAAEPAAEVAATEITDAKMADTEVTVTAFDILENDTVEIGFELENRSSAAVDLRYRLEVVATGDAGSQGATDVTEYKTLRIAPHGVVRERFSYTAPVYADGQQELHLTVKSAAGFPLAGTLVGTASFTGTPIPVTFGNCQLMDGKSGITVAAGLPSLITCTLRSTAEADQTMLLSGDLSLWGEETADRPVVTTDVNLEPGKDTSVTLAFPPLTAAGRYEGRVYLGNPSTRLSPVTDFVVQVAGDSAHITQVTLDRDAYTPGETATVTATILATLSDREHATVTATLTDESGSACAAPVTQSLGSGIETLAIPVQERCVNPKVALTVAASDGTTLDEATATLTTPDSGSGFPTGMALAALIVGVLGLIALTWYLVSRQRQSSLPRGSALVLALMIALGGLLSADMAKASTLSGGTGMPTDNFQVNGTGTALMFYTGNSGIYNGQITISGPMRVNGSVAMPTDNFSIIGSGNRINFYTGNSSSFAGALVVSGGTVSGSISCNTDAWSTTGSSNRWSIACSGPGGTITFTDTAPPVCVNGVGPYTPPQPLPNGYDNAWCQARGYDVSTDTCLPGNCACTPPRVWNGTICAVPPVGIVNGACSINSAQVTPNLTLPSPPAPLLLCSSGAPSSVTSGTLEVYPPTGAFAPTFSWSCVGSGGGTSAACYMFRTSAIPNPVTTFTGSYAGPPAVSGASALYLPSGGGTVTLNWNVTNAAGGSCTGYSSTNLPGWSSTGTAGKPITGSATLTVNAMTRFDLDCRNSSGTMATRKTVNVMIYSDAICPASATLNVGDPVLQLNYWRRLDGAPIDCTNPTSPAGASNLTADANASWSSSLPAVATVTTVAPKGRVTAVSGGATTVSVTVAGRGVVASAPITVNAAAAPRYVICPNGSTLTVGTTQQFQLWRHPTTAINCSNLAGASDITSAATTLWREVPFGTPIITVNDGGTKGLVRGNQGGSSADVSVTDSASPAGSATVTVSAAPAATYAICPSGSLALNTTSTTTVQLRLWRRANGTPVTCVDTTGATDITSSGTTGWSSSSGSVATVNSGGLVTAVAGGGSTISATDNGAPAGSVTVTVVGCTAYICTTLPSSVTDTYCPGESFTTSDNCSGTISCSNGTRLCDFNWKEVQQ